MKIAHVVGLTLLAVLCALLAYFLCNANDAETPVPLRIGQPRPAPILVQKGPREEIEYTFTFSGPNPQALALGMESKLKPLLSPRPVPSLAIGADNRIELPRSRYLDFVRLAEEHAMLKVGKRVFNVETPSDSPLPLILRFESGERR